MPDKPTTVTQYLASLPKDRRDALTALRKVIRANIDAGFKEGMQYGMAGWHVPHSVYPPGYHCDRTRPLPFAGMASQKHHMSLYLCGLYYSEDELRKVQEAWKKTGKKLDMGKSCIRFKTIDDLPLELIGKLIKRLTVKRHVAMYEAAYSASRTTASKKTTRKKTAKKKTATTSAAKRTTKKKVRTTGR